MSAKSAAKGDKGSKFGRELDPRSSGGILKCARAVAGEGEKRALPPTVEERQKNFLPPPPGERGGSRRKQLLLALSLREEQYCAALYLPQISSLPNHASALNSPRKCLPGVPFHCAHYLGQGAKSSSERQQIEARSVSLSPSLDIWHI